jgi:hypothetical protein
MVDLVVYPCSHSFAPNQLPNTACTGKPQHARGHVSLRGTRQALGSVNQGISDKRAWISVGLNSCLIFGTLTSIPATLELENVPCPSVTLGEVVTQ